jgi:hypothetical protein
MYMLVMITTVSDTNIMSEIPLSNEPISLSIERRSILACYVMRAAWQTTSEGFLDDLSSSISYVSNHSHFMTGKEITGDDTVAIASSSILAQMTASSINEKALILRPTVPKAIELFQKTQGVFDQLDLSLAINDLDQATVLATSRRIDGKPNPTTQNIEVAARIWNERGTVGMKMESVADIVTAIQSTDYSVEAPDIYAEHDGMRIEGFDMANLKNISSRVDMMPYFRQFFEVEHGKVWLSAILEDLQKIYSEIK